MKKELKALIVKSDGLIYAAELPEKPKFKGDYAQKQYEETLASATENAVLVADQEKAKEIIKAKFGHDIDKMNINTKGYQYPIPGLEWEVMYDSPLGLITDSPYSTDKKVAVIMPVKSEQKDIPALEVKPDNKIWLLPDMTTDIPAILCADQIDAEELIDRLFGEKARKPKPFDDLRHGIYPIPGLVWGIMNWSKNVGTDDSGAPIIKLWQVAILKESTPSTEQEDIDVTLSRQDLYYKVKEALRSYRLYYTFDTDDSGLSLVDALTPPSEESVTKGLDETDLLVDHIINYITRKP